MSKHVEEFADRMLGIKEEDKSERSPVERGVMKPCPFCGGVAKTRSLCFTSNAMISVYCDQCNIADTGFKPTKTAFELWNGRAL